MANNPYVNKVELADGTSVIDISDTTATASDVASGKYFYTAAGQKTEGTASGGGGGGGVEEKDVNFIDYDGSIVASYTAADFANLSALPSNPSHTGLTAQGWNWSLSDAKTYVASYGKLWIGQMYVTDDGKTRIYIHLDNPDYLSPYLAIAVNGSVSVDWGDGSSADTITGTSNTTLKYQQHQYAAIGDYVIAITVSSGRFTFYGANNYASVLRTVNAANNRARNQVYSNAITKVEIGSSVVIGNYGFHRLGFCKSITIPNTVTTIETYAFQYCMELYSVTIPNTVTSIGTYALSYCYDLYSVALPKSSTCGDGLFYYCYKLHAASYPSITSIGTYMFGYCYALQSIIIPSTVTSIGNSVFTYCYNLKSITIPTSVSSIGNSAFAYCYQLESITIPYGVATVGNNTFGYCYGLKSVSMPTTITKIDNYAFNYCYSLQSITIPANVEVIGNSVFAYCYDMIDYHFLPTTVPTFGTTVFNSIMTDTVIYVPSSKLSDYKNAGNMSTYANYMQGE